MKSQFNILDFLLVTVILLVCGVACVSYGSIIHSILTNGAGINGNLYWYYRVDKTAFIIYQSVVCLFATYIIIRTLYFGFIDDRKKVRRTFIQFVVFMIVVLLCETYLDSLYIGKG